jgi:hypothetical protein
MIRSLTLFAHVVGVLVLFAGLSVEWLSLASLRRSTSSAEGMPWVRLFSVIVPRASLIALVVILVSGLYLGARIGVLGNAWMRASYGGLVLMAIAGGPVTRKRIGALRHAADDSSDRAVIALRSAASDVRLRASLGIRTVFGLAVLFLMIAKPDTSESLFVLAVAAALALVVSVSRQAPSVLVERYE